MHNSDDYTRCVSPNEILICESTAHECPSTADDVILDNGQRRRPLNLHWAPSNNTRSSIGSKRCREIRTDVALNVRVLYGCAVICIWSSVHLIVPFVNQPDAGEVCVFVSDGARQLVGNLEQARETTF